MLDLLVCFGRFARASASGFWLLVAVHGRLWLASGHSPLWCHRHGGAVLTPSPRSRSPRRCSMEDLSTCSQRMWFARFAFVMVTARAVLFSVAKLCQKDPSFLQWLGHNLCWSLLLALTHLPFEGFQWCHWFNSSSTATLCERHLSPPKNEACGVKVEICDTKKLLCKPYINNPTTSLQN